LWRVPSLNDDAKVCNWFLSSIFIQLFMKKESNCCFLSQRKRLTLKLFALGGSTVNIHEVFLSEFELDEVNF